MTVNSPPLRNYIAGEWRESGDVYEIENPSDLDNPVGTYHRATRADVDEAVMAAREASPKWSAMAPRERGAILERVGSELIERSRELGAILSMEEGKTLSEGVGEVVRAGEIFCYYAAEMLRPEGELLAGLQPDVSIEVRRRPRGVIGIITPWNYPAAIPAWKMAPALAYGNTVILKPAELVPATAWAIVEVFSRSGLPSGTINLVMGKGSELGDALVSNDGVDGISFTGSTDVGRGIAVAAAARLTPVQLEMGGKNALVVLDDADLDLAVDCAVKGAYYSTGQRCTASSRLVVTDGIYPRFVEALTNRVRQLQVGHALDSLSEIGPVVNDRQLDIDLDYITVGLSEGAKASVTGNITQAETRGHFLTPTLFVDTAPDMRINREEIFGPVASVIRVADYEEALAVANDSDYGLVAGIITKSLFHASDFKRRAQVGMTMVNMPTAGMDYHAPFGGTKASGYGPREQGNYAREFYTEVTAAYTRS